VSPSDDLPRLEWVRPPQQERSQKTLERILDAAEVLFLQKGFERTGVAEICQKAGSSVGAFYARFPDKHALLRQIHERFCQQAIATAESILEPERWQSVPLEDFLRASIRFLFSVFRERRELIAALSRRETRDPDLVAFGQRIGEVLAARCHRFLVARGEAVSHPAPEEAIRFLVWILLSSLEAHTAHVNQHELLPGDRLIEHMVHMCHAHLGVERKVS
jgi:AcrR family transcriptional regulator